MSDLKKFAGMTVEDCPTACTPDRCVISTVNVCKHPAKSGTEGCGPITMANRREAAKYLGLQPKVTAA
jgi:hypothetical protein